MRCVILAGGSGTRFWPYSRSSRPKQLLNIVGEKSMLQMTVDRLKKIKKITHIYIITRKDLYDQIIEEVDGVDPKNVIVEPSGKNTAPAIGMMAALFQLNHKDEIMGVFPADHLIVGHKKFEKAINTADYIARKDSNLVTIGIKPTFASTAYGYIQYDENSEIDHFDSYHVKAFAEKPHGKLAKRFLSSGDFLWNAGMFFWRVDTFMDSLNKYLPELHDSLTKIAPKLSSGESFDGLWDLIEPESIDYGLLEKASNIYVVSGEFRWNDIGSWNALYDILNPSKGGNIVKGNGEVIKGKNNLIHSNGRLTAIVGADNLIVINTDDATLVVPNDKVEDVKELVEMLKASGKDNLI
ncbi:MAG: mannose-1-phosphate guanylyltransferase [Candidatus Neomarinimicrobiota bacterium]